MGTDDLADQAIDLTDVKLPQNSKFVDKASRAEELTHANYPV